MESSYVKAVETRARWLSWVQEEGLAAWNQAGVKYVPGYISYVKCLEAGDTFFMNKKFCQLVDTARSTVPDDLVFESDWVISPSGWMYLETPFEVPWPVEVRDAGNRLKVKSLISAIGWRQVPEGEITASYMDANKKGRVVGKGAYQFLMFQDRGQYDQIESGFNCWSYFMIQEGDKLIDRITEFETEAAKDGSGGSYGKDGVVDRTSNMLHEMRWVYTSIYLMSQKLAITVQHNTDRNTRRRSEREGRPVTPFIRIVTLRRYEQEKKEAERTGKIIDWQWQWVVTGHWRNQWFPKYQEHRPVWIESFVKGPADKPMKPSQHTIYVARR